MKATAANTAVQREDFLAGIWWLSIWG